MNSYKEFTITSKPFLPELLQGLLWELNISGIQEEEDHIKVFCAKENSTNQNEISAQLQKLVNEKVIESFIISEKTLENKNWNEEWEKSREAIVVSDNMVIKPSFKEYSAKPNQIVITIDPKMSFGTGEHQSTQLCLLFLEKYVREGMMILDVGTGTAVLAIASIKLGADKVIAIDNDECCYENSIENCEVNSVKEEVDIRLCEIKDVNEKDFDLVAANIQRDILLQIKKEIRERIRKNGLLILSGLLIHDKEEIQREYEALNFSLIDSKVSGEWISIVFLANEKN
jgi:ribosomal protein L11 methyltransferase